LKSDVEILNSKVLIDKKEIWRFFVLIGDLDGMHKMAYPECPRQKAHCHGDVK